MNTESILYIVNDCGFTGDAGRFIRQSAVLLRRAGFRVDCCFMNPAGDDMLFREGFDRIFHVEDLRMFSSGYDLAILHKIPAFSVLKDLESVFGGRLIFWAHDHEACCPARNRRSPICGGDCTSPFHPVRCTCCVLPAMLGRGMEGLREMKTFFLEENKKLELLSSHPAVVPSGFMRRILLKNGFPPENVVVIHPFVKTSERKTPFLPDGTVRILFSGQLIRENGCDLLIRALAHADFPFMLKIAGDGNERRRLESLVSKLNLSDRIIFSGNLPDPEILPDEPDLAVFPFRWQEPFGFAGLEASARGVPVVAFNTGGVSEWLKDGVNGFRIPPGNTDALANGISHAAALRFRLEQMGAEGIRLAECDFSGEQFLSAFKKLLEKTK